MFWLVMIYLIKEKIKSNIIINFFPYNILILYSIHSVKKENIIIIIIVFVFNSKTITT